MNVSGGAEGVGHEIHAVATRIEARAPRRRTAALSPEQCRYVRFTLDLVDLLAGRCGFDPADLVSPRTGAPLGPALGRMREALEASQVESGRENPRRQE